MQEHFQDLFESDIKNRAVIKDANIDGADDGYLYRSTLVLENLLWTDTGYYVCQYRANNSARHAHNSDENKEIYVYVRGIFALLPNGICLVIHFIFCR